jgi:hypothetical protein
VYCAGGGSEFIRSFLSSPFIVIGPVGAPPNYPMLFASPFFHLVILLQTLLATVTLDGLGSHYDCGIAVTQLGYDVAIADNHTVLTCRQIDVVRHPRLSVFSKTEIDGGLKFSHVTPLTRIVAADRCHRANKTNNQWLSGPFFGLGFATLL